MKTNNKEAMNDIDMKRAMKERLFVAAWSLNGLEK